MIQLGIPNVLNILDENTDLRRKKALTWDIIFKKVELFVELELDSIGQLTATLKKRQQVLYVVLMPSYRICYVFVLTTGIIFSFGRT